MKLLYCKMRKPHKLNKPSGRKRPTNVIFFDTETTEKVLPDGVKQQVFSSGYFIQCRSYGKRYLEKQREGEIATPYEFWKYVDKTIRAKSSYYLVAHNIVFDLTVLDGINTLHSLGWELESFYAKGLTSIFRWSKDGKTLAAVDNTNFFPARLAYWGKVIEYEKIDIDFTTATPEEILAYNIRDVEIMVRLWRNWLKFLDDNNCGNFKYTVPSTAFNTWAYRFNKSKVYLHSDEYALGLERASYKGGRTEVLFQGTIKNDKFYYLDVNNLYGYILANNVFPVSLVGVKETTALPILERYLEKYSVIADVELYTDDNYYPMKNEMHTCYPTGRFRTTLTTPELILANKRGWIQRLYSMAWYTQEPLFADYVSYFYNLRLRYNKQGQEGFAIISKLLVNSLYGKFGQRGMKQVEIGTCDILDVGKENVFDFESGEVTTQIKLGGKVWREEITGEAYNSFPAIAAHVTALARLHMKELINSVDSGHVYYMDTDSLIVDSTGYKQLADKISSDKLGYLKVELSSTWLTVHAPKDYAMDKRSKTKGVSESAELIAPNLYAQQQWVRLAGLIRSGDTSVYTIRDITKYQNREIFSGVVHPSGWVTPFRFPLHPQ